MNGNQLTLGAWTPEAQFLRDQLITAARLPKSITVKDRAVSRVAVLAVLRRIAHHAAGDDCTCPSVLQIAEETGHGRKTVSRAVEALQRLGIVDVELRRSPESRGTTCNHYRIRWDVVEALTRPAPHPETVPPGSTTTPSDEPPGPLDGPQWLNAAKRSDVPPGPTDGPPGPTDEPQWLNLHGVNVGVFKPPAPTHHSRREPARAAGDGVRRIHWGRRIEPAELLEPAHLLGELFDAAVLHGACIDSEADRISFAALLAYVLRQKRATNRFGLFTRLLSGQHRDRFSDSRDWRARPTAADEDQARRWWSQADPDGEELPRQTVAADPDAAAARERQHQAAAHSANARALWHAIQRGEFAT